jgi:glycosyltransferase involved in cell wall biosynthesis
MNIAILGTRGIPNCYGGFEQFAEILSIELVKNGHNVVVYNPDFHSYQEPEYQGVQIIYKKCYESIFGAAAHFIYDYECLADATKRNFDVILELGYGTAAPAIWAFHNNTKIITNMDGMEWRRSKWNTFTKWIMRNMEKIAVKYSHTLVADNIGIQTYLQRAYNVCSTFIPYSTEIFDNKDATAIQKYNLTEYSYYLTIARFEPENNLQMIIEGYIASNATLPLVIIGNTETKYGQYLVQKYNQHKNIVLLSAIYDKIILDNLRAYSYFYFHGHSVGGTNPSLLEAMGAGAVILAHNNDFNKSVLQENGYYFKDATEIANLIQTLTIPQMLRKSIVKEQINTISKDYTVQKIVHQYEALFEKVTGKVVKKNIVQNSTFFPINKQENVVALRR